MLGSLAPQSPSITPSPVRAESLQTPKHFAVWLWITLLVILSSKGFVSSPRAIQQATPAVSLSHNKSSAVPPGTQCKGPEGSLRQASGPVTLHCQPCPSQQVCSICKMAWGQPVRERRSESITHAFRLCQSPSASQVRGERKKPELKKPREPRDFNLCF